MTEPTMANHPVITDHPARAPEAIGLAPDRCVDCDQPLAWHQVPADVEARAEGRPMLPGFEGEEETA